MSVEHKIIPCEFGEGPYYALNKKIVRKQIPIPDSDEKVYGVFATDFIQEGEVCWKHFHTDNSIDMEISKIEEMPEEKRNWFFQYSYQITKDVMRGVKDTEKDYSVFSNHSCDPTNWFVAEGLFTATRDIQPGEEITFDYATSEAYDSCVHNCFCGSKNCRKQISANDWKRKSIQEKYKNHFSPYLQQLIDEQQEELKK